jgi:hypothetical protein
MPRSALPKSSRALHSEGGQSTQFGGPFRLLPKTSGSGRQEQAGEMSLTSPRRRNSPRKVFGRRCRTLKIAGRVDRPFYPLFLLRTLLVSRYTRATATVRGSSNDRPWAVPCDVAGMHKCTWPWAAVGAARAAAPGSPTPDLLYGAAASAHTTTALSLAPLPRYSQHAIA